MKKLMLLVFFAYMLQGCGSSATTNNLEVGSDTSGGTSICYQTFNLQVGENATYRFNIKGDVSYISAEVISENNESYTIAFSEENKEVEYYQWLKGCQSNSLRKAVSENIKAEYILTGLFNVSQYVSLNDNAEYNSNTQDNSIIIGTYNKSEKWLETFTIEAGTYNLVLKTFTEYSSNSIVPYEEQYTFEYGENLGINTPFGDHLKDIISFWDDTNITIELIEWNGL